MRLDVNDHATGFLKFIEVAQARRVGGLLQRGAKGRDKLRTMMAHGIKLEMKYARCFPDGPKYAKLICSALLLESAPPLAFVISEDSKLDGRVLPLPEVLKTCVGSGFGSFISCVPGKLGYFELKDRGEQYLLRRA